MLHNSRHSPVRHQNGDSGLPSDQDCRRVRKRQFKQGRRDAANTDWFGVSAYILGMEEEVDTCSEELLHIHVASSNLLSKKTAATSASTGAMTLVPVERAQSHRVTVPTVPPVALAGGSPNLSKHTPPTTLPEAFAMRCRNADVDLAMNSLKAHTYTGGRRCSHPARKKPKVDMPSPELPWRNRSSTLANSNSTPLSRGFRHRSASPSPSISRNSQRTNWHGDRQACTGTPTEPPHFPPIARTSTGRGRAAAPHSPTDCPDTRAESPGSDTCGAVSSDKHSLVAQTYNELQDELEEAHMAAEAALEAVREAEKKVVDVQDRIEWTPAPSSSFLRESHRPAYMQRLDGNIHILEVKPPWTTEIKL
ncbi:hypothetical protein HBI38_220360 [Parastagonospora nodorum]|nr:hypothetical protein HBH52_189490 [Parastagonospora nodorum]KAH4008686.1 hypothetical protein HBI13_231360 [Parastagonospora nodorum]KAH4112129.1 hypothetical protein HBH47_230500 [Parastagonospora nodorum]KAH4256781.1 hypothetical protein HBI04_226530 [Parastagonospora nodorum]KAH5240429.1 hypothetical protein HBI71_216850 [Parastagonospora nodorum]